MAVMFKKLNDNSIKIIDDNHALEVDPKNGLVIRPICFYLQVVGREYSYERLLSVDKLFSLIHCVEWVEQEFNEIETSSSNL